MPHQCQDHSHGGNIEGVKADLYTNVNTVIGGATSFLSMLFFVARAVDTFGDEEKKFAEMSYQAMTIGLLIALYASIGSTVCHRALNKNNQTDTTEESEINEDTSVNNTGIQSALSNLQKLMLLGDFIGHAADIASPILFITLYAFSNMQKYQKAILYAGCFVMGLFGSAASVRTCKKALLIENNRITEAER